MRILQITPSYKPAFIYGGPIYSVGLLAEALTQAGHDVTVLTTTANGEEELDISSAGAWQVENVPVYYYPRWSKDHTHFSPRLLAHVWRECRQFDAVHIHSWWNWVAVLSVLVCLARRVTPLVSPRGMLSSYSFTKNNVSRKSLLHGLLGKWLLKNSILHATSDDEFFDLQQFSQRIFHIPNLTGIPKTDKSLVDLEHSDGEINLGILSRLHEKKNLEGLFKALSKIEIDYRLAIAGTGTDIYTDKLKKVTKSEGIDNKIYWLGALDEEKKFAFLSQLDLLLLLSYNENFANVVLEALSVGTAVVVSEQVGLAGYVRKNDLGWVCTIAADDMHATLLTAMADEKKRSRIRHQAVAKIQRDFSASVLVPRYGHVYLVLGRR